MGNAFLNRFGFIHSKKREQAAAKGREGRGTGLVRILSRSIERHLLLTLASYMLFLSSLEHAFKYQSI